MRQFSRVIWPMLALFCCCIRLYAQETGPPDKPWRLTLSVGAGYNDNVAAIDDGLAIGTPGSTLPFASDRGSATGRFSLDFACDLLTDDDQILTVGYRLFADVFEGTVDAFNEHDHHLWAGYQRKLNESLVASMTLDYRYANLDGSAVQHAFILAPSLAWRVQDWLTAELNAAIDFNDFKTPLPFGGAAAAARDGQTYSLGGSLYIDVPGTELHLLLAWQHRWSFTEGGAFDFDEDRLTFGLNHPLPLGITGDLRYSHVWQEYDGLGPREDETDIVSILLTRPVSDSATIYVRYDYINNDSNGILFDFHQNAVAIGLIFNF